jgi:hypothetical protein
LTDRNPPEVPAPFIHPPDHSSAAAAGQGQMQLQTADRRSECLVGFDHNVIGGEVVYGEKWFDHASLLVRAGAGCVYSTKMGRIGSRASFGQLRFRER